MPKPIRRTSSIGDTKVRRDDLNNPYAKVSKEEVRRRLEWLFKKVGPVPQEWIKEAERNSPAGRIVGSTMADAAKVVGEIEWLVPNWIPLGMLTGIVAAPKAGKSAFVFHEIVRPIVTGCDWFDGSKGTGEPGYVVWCDTERRMAINLDRMQKWNIPTDRIVLPFEDPLKTVNLTDDDHLRRIETLVKRYKAKAFIVDSLRGSHNDDENNSRVGSILQNIAGIAERTGVATPVVHHTRKLAVDEELTPNSSRGSNAILANFAAMIGVDIPDPNSERRRLQMLDENLGVKPKPIGFEISDSGLTFVGAPSKPGKGGQKIRATEWLLGRMELGRWYPSKEILADGEAFGLSSNAVQRAREELGITIPAGNCRKAKSGKWEWRLPRGNS